MQWIILDRGDADGRRLEAIRLEDGGSRVLIAHDQASGYRAAIDPTGRVVAATVEVSGGPGARRTTRCALVDLDRMAVRWLQASLDPAWHLQDLRFADTGRRIVTEGTHGAAAAHDVFVFRFDPTHPLDSEAQALLAGAANPQRTGLRQPAFAPGGHQVFYLRRAVGDEYQVVVLDVDKDGDSAGALKVDAPSRRVLALTEPMGIAPDAGLAYAHQHKLLFFAAIVAGKQRLARKPLTGQGPRMFWRTHSHIDTLALDPDGEGAAYIADGQLWWADLELDDVISLAEGVGGSCPELLACLEDGWILYGTRQDDGSTLHALHRPSRTHQVLWEGSGALYGFCRVPDASGTPERFAALPPGPLDDYVPSPEALAALEAAQAEAARIEAERLELDAAKEAVEQRAEEEALRARARRMAEETLQAEQARVAAREREQAARRAARLEARRKAELAAKRARAEAAAEREAAAAAAEQKARAEAAAREAESARRAQRAREAEDARRREAERARQAAARAEAAVEAARLEAEAQAADAARRIEAEAREEAIRLEYEARERARRREEEEALDRARRIEAERAAQAAAVDVVSTPPVPPDPPEPSTPPEPADPPEPVEPVSIEARRSDIAVPDVGEIAHVPAETGTIATTIRHSAARRRSRAIALGIAAMHLIGGFALGASLPLPTAAWVLTSMLLFAPLPAMIPAIVGAGSVGFWVFVIATTLPVGMPWAIGAGLISLMGAAAIAWERSEPLS